MNADDLNNAVEAAWMELKRQLPHSDDLSRQGNDQRTLVLPYDGFDLRAVIAAAVSTMTAENERLRAALRTGCGAAINDLPAGQREWSPDSGVGVMLKALGCDAVVYGDDVYNAVRLDQQSGRNEP